MLGGNSFWSLVGLKKGFKKVGDHWHTGSGMSEDFPIPTSNKVAHVYNLIKLLGLHMCLYLILDFSDLCQTAHFLLSVGYYSETWVSETQ